MQDARHDGIDEGSTEQLIVSDFITRFENAPIVENVRETGKGRHIVVELIKFLVVIYVADALTNKFPEYVISHAIEPFASIDGIWLIAIGTLSFAALAYCALWERMRPRHLGVAFRPARKTAYGTLAGYACGAALMMAAVVVAVLAGGGQIHANGSVVPFAVLSYFAIYLFQAFGEEVLYRGAFLIAAVRKNNAWIALVVSSLVFSLHHHFNAGYGPIAFVNLFLLAMLLGISVLVTNRIWMATAMHAAWNFFQGNVFGVTVSGSAPNLSTTVLTSSLGDNALISGGAMGLEGSLVTTLVLSVGLAVCLWLLYRKKPLRDKCL